MGEDPTEQDDARTDPTRCRRDAARTCAPPDVANSAAMSKDAIEDLLLGTSGPKWRRENQTAAHLLGVATVPLRTIPSIAL